MDGILDIVGVLGLFMLRVGLPVLFLVTLGILIDRWQTHREAEFVEQHQLGIETEGQEEAEDDKKRKVA